MYRTFLLYVMFADSLSCVCVLCVCVCVFAASMNLCMTYRTSRSMSSTVPVFNLNDCISKDDDFLQSVTDFGLLFSLSQSHNIYYYISI